MAEPEKNPLEKLIAWVCSWKASFEWLQERIGRLGAVVVVLAAGTILAIFYIWSHWKDIKDLPGVPQIVTRFEQSAIPNAPAGRLTIAVARLEDDKDREHEKQLRAGLEDFEGVETLPIDRQVEWPASGTERENRKQAEDEARRLLKQSGADVLIWGRVVKRTMRLYWTPSRDISGATARGNYQSTETIALPEAFWDDLKQIFGLLSQSRLAELTSQSEHYVADKLGPLIGQVRALAQSKEGVWNAETLAGVQFALAGALFNFGEQSGTNEPLDESAELYHKVLEQWSRERVPLQWAEAQMNLGNALARRGEQEDTRERGIPLLQAAIAAYGEALKKYTRAGAPRDWAMAQMNRGNALETLGERERDRANLEEAANAYRESLQELTREGELFTWANAQMGLGDALETLGELESGTVRLNEARVAYGEALKVYNRAREPLVWAKAQFNLGSALKALGEREVSVVRLEEGIAAYREALKERTREHNPRAWAMTQNNLAKTLFLLGQLESRTAALEGAAEAFREALKEWTRERDSFSWAMTTRNLGNVLETLGEREKSTARLKDAVTALREALQEITRAQAPLLWAVTQLNLGDALRAQGELEGGTERLGEAVTAYHEALTVFDQKQNPDDWQSSQDALNRAQTLLAQRKAQAEDAMGK